MAKTFIMEHSLIQHKIGYIRRIETGTKDFRQTIKEISVLICYEATRNLPLTDVEIETPICKAAVKELCGKKMAVVPILRAGLICGGNPYVKRKRLPENPFYVHSCCTGGSCQNAGASSRCGFIYRGIG